MSGFSAKANELLVEIYRNVQILEQNELKKQRLNISINEMHMIELIAKGKTGMTVSEIAQQLKVTKPSVTVAVNKLVQKGYCEKQRLPGDGRAVQVMLTPEGKKWRHSTAAATGASLRKSARIFRKRSARSFCAP